jgi:hypothetical protein
MEDLVREAKNKEYARLKMEKAMEMFLDDLFIHAMVGLSHPVYDKLQVLNAAFEAAEELVNDAKKKATTTNKH